MRRISLPSTSKPSPASSGRVCCYHHGGIMCPMGQLRSEEAWVKACIEQELPRAQVDQHDDGSQPSMYDLKITYPDGMIAAVEVTSAMDEQQIRVRKSTRGRAVRWQEPNLVGGWDVRVAAPEVPKDLKKRLPDLLRDLERANRIAVRGDKSSSDQPAAMAGSLGVKHVSGRQPIRAAFTLCLNGHSTRAQGLCRRRATR